MTGRDRDRSAHEAPRHRGDDDAPSDEPHGHRLLVVASTELDVERLPPELANRLGADTEVHVVSPVTRLTRLEWLANAEDDARSDAERISHDASASLAGAAADVSDGGAGDVDPIQAIEDALVLFPADEVVIVVSPPDQEAWLERAAIERLDEIAIPVAVVVAGD
jgi:hypothetical protein